MTVRLGIVRNPFRPDQWEEVETDDVLRFLVDRFGRWPAGARIYDLEDVGDWTRAAAMIDRSALGTRDLTPRDEAGIDRLAAARGPLLVTVAPADPGTLLIATIGVAAALAATFILMPRPRVPNQQATSPNNQLSDRANRPRPNMRIPDNYGRVLAIPDLLSVPYSVFEDHREIEYAFLCLGRGAHDVEDVRDGETRVSSIAGASVAVYGPGTAPGHGSPEVEIGTPITDPVLGVAKIEAVNGQTLRPPNTNFLRGDKNVRFVAPDQIVFSGDDDLTDYFEPDDEVTVAGADFGGSAVQGYQTLVASLHSDLSVEFDTFDPTDAWDPGDQVTMTGAVVTIDDGVNPPYSVDLSGTYSIAAVDSDSIQLAVIPFVYDPFQYPYDPYDPNPPPEYFLPGVEDNWAALDALAGDATAMLPFAFSAPASSAVGLNGTYTVLTVTSNTLTLSNPSLVNDNWDDIVVETAETSAVLSTTGDRWIGPFIVEAASTDRLLANFAALQGLYKDDGKKKFRPFPITVEVEATPVNSGDIAIGPPETFPVVVAGNDDRNRRDARFGTLWCDPTFEGRMSVRARRVTPTDLSFEGTVIDEVKWRDLYGISPVDVSDLGDVTTVHARTYATASALSVKERKLSMIATRRVPQRQLDGSFSAELFASADAADVLCAVALDPYIGAMTLDEIDVENVYAALDEAEAYFGTPEVREFGYTFDDDQMSAEESLAIVASAVHCEQYRRGRVLRLSFERATDDSVLLFNRRNVLPGTTERTTRFGPLNDHDGLELDYADPEEREARTYFIPPDRSAVRPRSARPLGVNSETAAYFHAWRTWYKVLYQNVTAEFEATQEAQLVIRGERVLLSDMTRPDRIDGEVEHQDGAELTLSSAVDLDPDRDWVIFLQHLDATVEVLGVSAWEPGVGEDPDPYRVTLSAAPRLALVIDEGVAVGKAKFIIATSDDRQVRAFVVAKREPQSRFTSRVTVGNYSFLYYQNDQLALWLPIFGNAVVEMSVNGLAVDVTGDVTVELDDQRGKRVVRSVAGTALTFPDAPVAPASYSKAAWLMIDADDAANVLGAGSEVWGPDGVGNVVANHGAAGVATALPTLGEWHHWAVTYDEDAELLCLYLDGVMVDSQDGVARGALAAPTGLNGLVGRVDDLRLWVRALSAGEVQDLYRSSIILAMTGPVTTEDGRELLTEDGEAIVWE